MRELAYFIADEDSDVSRLENIADELRLRNLDAKVTFQFQSPNQIPETTDYSELRVAVIDGESTLYTDPTLPNDGLTYVILGGDSKFGSFNGKQVAKNSSNADIAQVIMSVWRDNALVDARAKFRYDKRDNYAIDGLGRVGESLARALLSSGDDVHVYLVDRTDSMSKQSRKKFEAGVRNLTYIPEIGRVSNRVHVVSPSEAIKESFGVFLTFSDSWLTKNPVNDRTLHYVFNAPILRKLVTRDIKPNQHSALPFWFPLTNYNFMLAVEMQSLASEMRIPPEVFVPPGGDVFRIRDGLTAALEKHYGLDPDTAFQKASKSDIYVSGTHWHPIIRTATKVSAFGEHDESMQLDELFNPQEIQGINEWALRRADDSFLRGQSRDLEPGILELLKRFKQRDEAVLGAPFLVSKAARSIVYEPDAQRMGHQLESVEGVDDTFLAYKYTQFSTNNLGELKNTDPPYRDSAEFRRDLKILITEHAEHERRKPSVVAERKKVMRNRAKG